MCLLFIIFRKVKLFVTMYISTLTQIVLNNDSDKHKQIFLNQLLTFFSKLFIILRH